MGTWTLNYTTGYNANTWDSVAFATYKAGNQNEEITSLSAYFGVASSGTVYGPGTETNTDWDRVTGNGSPCSLTMFSGSSTATVSIIALCGRSGSSASGWYPNFSDTVLYTWTFSTPIAVSANSSVTIYCKKGSGLLCNGNGSSRKGNITGVAGVPTRYITYDANGGSGAPAVQSCVKGVATTVSSTKPTKSKETAKNYTVTFSANGGSVSTTSIQSTKTTTYSFLSWNTQSNGNGTSYNAGASITLTDNITLYAKYSSNTTNDAITTPTATRSNSTSTYTVTFDGNNGTPTETSLTSNATVTYTADGWYTSGGVKRCSNGGSYTPTSAETLSQKWNSATGTFSAITLPSASRTGYIFAGWATSSSATSAQYGAGASYTPSGNQTLYAVWTSQSFTVSYNANTGSGSMTDDTAYYGQDFITKQNTFTKTGYSFIGWNEQADGKGTAWNANTSGTYENGTPWKWTYNKSITLYAQWAPWTYTITYDKNGATSGSMSSSSHTYGDASSKVSPIGFIHPGYNFMGWSNSKNGAVICSDQGSAPYQFVTQANQTLTLYALWSQDSPWTLTQIKLYDSTNQKWWTC